MEPAEQLAADLLESLGLDVEFIPESKRQSERRADLCATDSTATYLIEVKHKLDDPDLLQAEADRMAKGEVVSRSEPTTHHNTMSGILTDAGDQLRLTPAEPDVFRLLWLHVDGIDGALHRERAVSTFYGKVFVWPVHPAGGEPVECYYFDYSVAWSHRNIDGMILCDGEGVQLLLNEFSDRFAQLAETPLHGRFLTHNAVVNPHLLAAEGKILSLMSDVPRKNDVEVLDALTGQTGVVHHVIRMTRHSAAAMVRDEDLK